MDALRFAQPLLIRHARPTEGAALHAACFPDQPKEWVEDYLAWCLAAPGRPTRLVARLDGDLVGHVELALRQSGAWAEASSLAVADGWRGQGIGRRLVGAALRLARRWGCDEVRLQVQVSDSRLIALYRRWGFQPRGTPLMGRCWLAHPLHSAPLPAPDPLTLPLATMALEDEEGER